MDHPATQQYKRSHAGSLAPSAAALVHVAVDFERDALAERLAQSGHAANRPTLWLWEGVVMYLSDAALRATLHAVVERSAPGSRLAVHYHEPSSNPAHDGTASIFLRLIREPWIGLRTRAVMRREVEAAGLEVRSDEGAEEWARESGAQAVRSELVPYAGRLLVAERR